MVGAVHTGGSRRFGGDSGGSKCSVRGNEFGVCGGENFVVGDERVHHFFVVGDGGGKVVHAGVQNFHESGQLGCDCCVLGPGGMASRMVTGVLGYAVDDSGGVGGSKVVAAAVD